MSISILRGLLWQLAVIAVLGIAARAFDAGPAVVVLTSGNRITGSISEMSRGNLSFTIDGAGGTNIIWDNVESLESTQNLDVELASGERFSGAISTPSPGKFEVKTSAGPKVVDMKDVIRIQPVAATFAERTSGSIDVGYNFSQSQNSSNLVVDFEGQNRTKNYLTKVSYGGSFDWRDDAESIKRNTFIAGSRRFVGGRRFVLGNFEVQNDTQLDLDLRILVAGAFGRTFVQSNQTVFTVYGGIDYDQEQYAGVPGTDHSAEALGTIEWDWFRAGGKTSLSTEATTYVTLNRARVRFQLETSLRRDFFRNYYWGFRVFEAYDSNPPAPVPNNNDFGVAVTIGRTF